METDESGESQETSKEDIGSSTSPPPAEPETQSEPPTVKPELESEPEPEWVQKLRRVISVLGGECTVALRQDFLIRNNHTDLLVLKIMKVWCMAMVTWPSCGHTPSACGHAPPCLWSHPSTGCESQLHFTQRRGGGQRLHALWDDCRHLPSREPRVAEEGHQLG